MAIAVIAVLVSFLLSALQSAANKSKEAKCVVNMKTIGTAIVLFANDNNGYWPAIYSTGTYNAPWYTMLNNNYVNNKNAFLCPAGTSAAFNADHISYGYNYNIGGGGTSAPPEYKGINRQTLNTLILLADSMDNGNQQYLLTNVSTNSSTTKYAVGNRHRGGANVLWGDYHISWELRANLQDQPQWTP